MKTPPLTKPLKLLPAAFFAANRQALLKKLPPATVAVLHANDPLLSNGDTELPFRQNSNLFYLTGIEQPDTILVLYKLPNPAGKRTPNTGSWLFLTESDPQKTLWEGETLSHAAAQAVGGIKDIFPLSAFEARFHALATAATTLACATNEHARAKAGLLAAQQDRNHRFALQARQAYPLHSFLRLAPLLSELRSVKQPAEVAAIKHAVEVATAGFKQALRSVKPGAFEYTLEAEFFHAFRSRGLKRFAFPPIVASGKNTCTLHYTQNQAQLKDGDLVLLDLGVTFQNYNSDLTRVFPVSGRFTARQKAVYQAVLAVMRRALKILSAKITFEKYHQEIKKVMVKELAGLGLIKKKANEAEQTAAVKRYFMHGLSHHLGLEVHDEGALSGRLREGMVLTVEPGIYVREEAIGVRLENNVLIEKSGCRNLSAALPIEVEEIEALMQEQKNRP